MKDRLAFLVVLFHLSAFCHAETVGPFGGDVRSLAIHPARAEILLLGTSDGQIYRSTDGAASWQKVVPGIGYRGLVIDNLIFDPTHNDRVYAATWDLRGKRGELFRSDDAGLSWKTVQFKVPQGNNNTSIRAIAVSPRNGDVIVLGTLDGVYRTWDGGKNWSRISRGNKEYADLIQIESVAIDPRDDDIIYAGTWHLGYKTTNGGKTWIRLEKGMLVDSDLFSIQIDPTDPETIFASACSGIYKSANGGLLWTRLKNGLSKDATRTRSFLISPKDPKIVYAGTTEGLYKSFDGGSNWTRLTQAGLTINAIAAHPHNADIIFLATDDVGILKSTNEGKTFQPANRGFAHRHVAAMVADPTNPDRIYAGVLYDGEHGGFFISDNGGDTWRSSNSGLQGDYDVYEIVSSADGSLIWINTRRRIYISADRGLSWEKTTGLAGKILFQVRKRNDGDLVAWTDAGVYRSATPEGPWQKTSELPLGVSALLPMPASSEFWLAVKQRLYRTADDGASWRQFLETGLPSIKRILWSGNQALAATQNGLFISKDKGMTWRRVRAIPSVEISSLVRDPVQRNYVYVADQLLGRLYFSPDDGLTWQSVPGLPSPSISALHIHPSQNTLLAATLTEGIYRIQLGDVRSLSEKAKAGGGQ